MPEKFDLKWNDFHSNVSKSFGLFRKEDYLHDVTLVSDDYKQVTAHKLVLSACSEYCQAPGPGPGQVQVRSRSRSRSMFQSKTNSKLKFQSQK